MAARRAKRGQSEEEKLFLLHWLAGASRLTYIKLAGGNNIPHLDSGLREFKDSFARRKASGGSSPERQRPGRI